MKKIILAYLLVLALLASCYEPSAYEPAVTSWAIKYEITGTATTADVTYENSSGGTSQEAEVALPWSYSFTGHVGDFVYISAQNQGPTGTVIATIYKGSVIFKSSTSSGAYVIASAYGSL